MTYDVVIIGGGFAGFSAAMQLVRAQCNILIMDEKKPRNRFSKASHGVFGLDGKSPSEIREIALSQLSVYPTFEIQEGRVIDVKATESGFLVITNTELEVFAKRIILATGTQDKLPEVKGIKEHWGKSVVHCPYCHGYELRGGKLGVLASSEMSFHQAAMIPDWGETTFFSQGQYKPEGEVLAHLLQRGIKIEHTPILEVEGDGEQIHHARLEDNRVVPMDGLFVGPNITIATPLVERLALQLEETPLGQIVKVDDFKESSQKGVFVAGDLSNAMQSGTLAVASGALAGIAAHRSLIFNQ